MLNGNLFGPVKRPQEIIIEAFDGKGKKFRLTCDGILARVIQHEYDHILGSEFTQKVHDYSKLLSREFYIKNVRNSVAQLGASKVTILKAKEF